MGTLAVKNINAELDRQSTEAEQPQQWPVDCRQVRDLIAENDRRQKSKN